MSGVLEIKEEVVSIRLVGVVVEALFKITSLEDLETETEKLINV